VRKLFAMAAVACVAGILANLAGIDVRADGLSIPSRPPTGSNTPGSIAEQLGKFEVEVETDYEKRRNPEWTYGSFFDNASGIRISDSTDGGSVKITLNYSLGDRLPFGLSERRRAAQMASRELAQALATLPARRWHYRVSGSFSSDQGSGSATISAVVPAVGLRKIGHFPGGTLTAPFDVIPGGVPFTATLDTRFERYEGSLGIDAATPVSPVSSVVARIAVFGGGEIYDYRFTLTDPPAPGAPPPPGGPPPAGGPLFEGFVRERLTTAYFGGTFAVSYRHAITDRLSVAVGGLVGIFYYRLHLEGSDCTDADSTTRGCQPFVATSGSISATRLGYRTSFNVGADYNLGFMSIGATGRVGVSSVPKIVNPSAVGTFVTLTTASKLNYGFGLRAAIPLPF